jgi:PPIC-type PPIASE domain
MFRLAVAVLIVSCLCAAQTTPPPKTSTPAKPKTGSTSSTPQAGKTSATPTKPAPSKAAEVPETAAIITLNGVCEKPDAGGQCKTVITRAEFERLAGAINPSNGVNPPLPPEAKRQIASRYSQFLALADQAKKQKLDQTPQAKELEHFAELQALAQLYMSSLQAKSLPSAAEVQKYYDDNKARFEKMTVERILVPANPGPDAKNVTAETLKQTAQKIYERAKAGEDFDKLQKEAFTAAGIQSAPEAKMVLNPASLPPSQAAVRQLKPGEVSPLFSEVSGSYMYKMVSSELTPLDQVRTEIERALQRQKFQEAATKLIESVKPDLNEAYFGPTTKASQAPPERD